jgi:tRNA-modifying protein YgfZ
MSDKLNFSSASISKLHSYGLLALEGPDAVAFAQAQSMNDVKALADGQWHWNGLLNPKGRLIALFALLRIRADLLYLVLPDFPAEKLEQHLQRFVFRSKVKIVVPAESIFAVEFDFKPSSEQARDFATGDIEQGVALDFSSHTLARRLWILTAPSTADISFAEAAEVQWRNADLAHGLPRLSETQTELWTPQMLSLEHLNAFSLKKGCYPGQEIVARTHYLGQAKRKTWRVQGSHLSVAAAVCRSDEKMGEIICVNSAQDSGLALLQGISESDLLACGENEVRLLQSLTGLQRPT